MSETNKRILESAESIYAGAVRAFEEQDWGFAELNASVSMGACAVVLADPDTPSELRARAKKTLVQGKALVAKSRTAEICGRPKKYAGVSVEKGDSRGDEIMKFMLSAMSGDA